MSKFFLETLVQVTETLRNATFVAMVAAVFDTNVSTG